MSGGKQGYVVGFTVHEAKDLARDGVAIDPLVVVRTLGREYKTDLKRNKMAYVKFEESFIWSDIQLTEDEYNSAFIDFELQSACVFSRNEVVGSGKVQLAMVKKRPNHTYVKKWIQLSKDTMLTAKMKVTVFSYGEGQDPPRPEDLENDADETAAQLKDLNAAVLNMDPSAGIGKTFTTGYHLFVQVHRCEHLGGGTQMFNPYVSVEFAGNTLSTPSAKDTHTLACDEAFRLPVTMPLFSDSIIIRVWDKKSWSSDQIIVQGRLSFSLIRTHALQPKWFNFYGFDKEEVPDVTQLHSTGERPEPNCYQGRILVSGRAQKVMKESDLFRPAILKGLVQDEPASLAATLLVDVHEISGCPGAEVYMHVSVGKKSRKTKPVPRAADSPSQEAEDLGIFRFKDDRGRVPPMHIVVPADANQQLDIIVSIYSNLGYLLQGRNFQRVGFTRIKLQNLQEWKGEPTAPRWFSCKPMAHLPSSIEPGSLLLSMYKCAKNVTDRVTPIVRMKRFMLRTYACMARDLKSSVNASPSAFLHVSCAGEVDQTEAIPYSSAPSWGKCLQLPIRLQVTKKDPKAYPEPIQIVVYDQVDEGETITQQIRNMAKDAAKHAAGISDSDSEEDKNLKSVNDLKQSQELTTKALRVAENAMDTMVTTYGLMTGDIMAKKKVGSIANGRRVIGRLQVNYRKIMRPGQEKAMRPKWVKIYGGAMGNEHAGDVLVGFELLKMRHRGSLPPRDLHPNVRKCSVFVSVLGLRNVSRTDGGEVTKPVLQALIPSVSNDQHSVAEEKQWNRKPDRALHNDDHNKKWCCAGKSGFEFLQVFHLEASLPEDPKWESSLHFVLSDNGIFIGESRVSLAHYLPWINHEQLDVDKYIESREGYSDSDEDEAQREGIPVSEDDDDADDESGDQYVSVRIENEPLHVGFNSNDKTNFPPRVSSVGDKGKPAKAGVRVGDWLISVNTPKEKGERSTATWKGADAADYFAKLDKARQRPVTLRFRRELQNEVSVPVRKGPLGCSFQNTGAHPPRFERDASQGKIYSRAAVDPGWALVAVNGTDVQGMTAASDSLKNLLNKRPAILSFRAPPGVNIGQTVDERKITADKPVQLNGVPLKLLMETARKRQERLKDTHPSITPKPNIFLPSVSEAKRLNLHPARSACLDVTGIIHAITNQVDEGVDDADDHARPTVPGRLELNLPPPSFDTSYLYSGTELTGYVKFRLRVNFPANEKWGERLNPKDHEAKFFTPTSLRKWIKVEMPSLFRIRTYIVRGLNVSGSSSGYGSPYLYFNYAQQPVRLPNHRQNHTTEPRFFRTEERDVKLPEQSIFEVGLMDYVDGHDDPLIGRTTVDLEDRWFLPMYQDLIRGNKVPIEYRPLESGDAGSLCKGSLEMWIELLDATAAAEIPLNPLRAPPPIEVEIRVAIFTARDISLRLCVDDHTGEQREKVDLIFRCAIDCKAYNGSQPREQETDVHHGSQGDAEFNWRFVYSRITVTKGVPIDCFIQLSLWEHFIVMRPALLCESLIEMKNYCKKVAATGDAITIEADLPLTNLKLQQLLKSEEEGGYYGEYDDADGGSDDDDDEDDYEIDPDAMNNTAGATDEPKEQVSGAIAKVIVQVYSQVEASMEDMKVGTGRNEPNRNPVLPYPKTGRNWKSVLPTALAIVEAVIDTYQSGTKRCKFLCCAIVIVLIICFLSVYQDPHTKCPLIKQSCRTNCDCCKFCGNDQSVQSLFCYYIFLRQYPEACATDGGMNLHCRCLDKCSNSGTADTCDVNYQLANPLAN